MIAVPVNHRTRIAVRWKSKELRKNRGIEYHGVPVAALVPRDNEQIAARLERFVIDNIIVITSPDGGLPY